MKKADFKNTRGQVKAMLLQLLIRKPLALPEWAIMLTTNEAKKGLLGSKADKLFKISIKTSNVAEFIESDIQNIEAPRTDDHII